MATERCYNFKPFVLLAENLQWPPSRVYCTILWVHVGGGKAS
jgi:hypothetical protein